jgi:hypothetical protein
LSKHHRRSILTREIGFLDLPPETRLQIYDLLLLNRSPDGDLYAVNMVDSRKRRKTSYEPFAIYSSGEKSGRTPAKGPKNSCDYIHASILRTCQQIANEGLDVLYSKNVFAIDLSREAIVPLNLYPFKRRARAIIRHISKHTQQDEEGHIVLPQYVNELASHAFLSRIGEQNATAIKHVEIFSQHTNEYKKAMPIITMILKQQIPRLRTAAFHIVAHGGDHRSYLRDEYENAIETRRIVPTGRLWPFDPNNPHIGTGSWPEVRDAIKHFIHEIPSLEVLKYGGCWNFACLPPLPYITSVPARIHFDGNEFDGYHWRLAMEESDALEEEVRKNYVERRKEMNMAARDMLCPDVVNLRRLKRARLAEEGGVRKSVLRFFDGIFWVDS